MTDNNAKVFGFDIGIGSTGSAVASGNNMIYMGTHVFDTATEAKESRTHRSARRNLSRKKWRKQQLLDAFDDFGIISKSESLKPGYLCFTTNNAVLSKPADKTVYHLRVRALTEQVTKREILMCLYNMLHARGHFLMETIDFTQNTITFEDYKERFYEATGEYVHISDENRKIFEKDILIKVFSDKMKSRDLSVAFKNRKFLLEDEESENALYEILQLLGGFKANVRKISPEIPYKSEKCYVNELKDSADPLPDFLTVMVELYDLSHVYQILKNHNYLCEIAAEKIDHFDEVIEKYGVDSAEYKDLLKEIGGVSSSKASHKRILRNLENSYPNGLYRKECSAILRKQQEYYPEITNDFIEVCGSIISARIPYFIGPLNENGKNAWVKKDGKIKYSYEYAMDHGEPVDQLESIRRWKERMISRCTYLPDEYALPKGSFLSETFNILNELNILRAFDKDGNRYYLTQDDKIYVIDNLFMTGAKVAYKDVANALNLKSFGTKDGNKKMNEAGARFNNAYTLYPRIAQIIPELQLNSILDIFKEKEKVEEIERIILSVNLYDEERTKIDCFLKDGYLPAVAVKLAKLKSVSFCSYSKKFIFEQPVNSEGESLIDCLFKDNTKEFTNEQMTLISYATDRKGNPVDFKSNKYVRKLNENGGKLDISLLMDDGKPVIPVSRPVIRALNETLKVYSELVNTYGVPDRVVIETARDLTAPAGSKTVPFAAKVKSTYDHLIEQLGGEKEYKKVSDIESWDVIETYLKKYKAEIELYIQQDGRDLLTNQPIVLSKLNEYEIDHILPRGFGDDSMDDKMLISKLANGRKGDRLPIQFIETGEKINDKPLPTTSEFIDRVERLYDMNLITEKKRDRLLLENTTELEGFINQNLVDTRYIIKEFMSILRAYNTVHNYDTHIVAMKSAYTSVYRKAARMDKNRNFGDQHHAHDAALLIVADRTLSSYYPHYDERKHVDNENFKTYSQFVKELGSEDKKEKDKLIWFIRKAIERTYSAPLGKDAAIIAQIKNTVPFYSTKAERNYAGTYHDATIFKHDKYKKDSVLSIIGIDNNRRVFSGVNCAAVDFYKVTDEKGRKEHIAINIPKAIINSRGEIDKEKYIALIRRHYKKDILLDENGELKTGYFRFRAFKNDIIYNTATNCPMLFNIGSIVNKKLEMKFINVFSYNNIYSYSRDIANHLVKHFNLRTRENKDGLNINDITKDAIVSYVAKSFWNIDPKDKRCASAVKKIEKETKLNVIADQLAYIGLIINRPGTPPTIDGQYKPVANADIIKADPDAQYVKLKYSILGLKFDISPKGKMIVSSPEAKRGAFKKITKEEFSWKISRDNVE